MIDFFQFHIGINEGFKFFISIFDLILEDRALFAFDIDFYEGKICMDIFFINVLRLRF